MPTTTISSVNNDTPSGIAKYWLQRVRAQPDPSLPKATREGRRRRKRGQDRGSDAKKTDAHTSWWTDSQDDCQVYYDLENAFRCAGILASLTDQDIEVVALDE